MLYFYVAVFIIIGGIITSLSDTAQGIILSIVGLIFLPLYPIVHFLDKFLFG